MKTNKLWNRIMQSYGAKTLFFAAISLVANMAFAVMNGVVAVIYSSIWYGTLAGYYVILIAFRAGVILANTVCGKFMRNDSSRERAKVKIYLAGGVFLVVLEIAMATAITQMVSSPKPVKSGQIVAIATAAYTFYTMTMAIINIFKARLNKDYVIQTLRNVNFAAACMAMLSLTVSLISTFGDSAEMLTMKAAVGLGACILTLCLAIYMIARASKILKPYKEISNDD